MGYRMEKPMTDLAPWYQDIALPALLRWGQQTYGAAMRRALAKADCDDIPPNGMFVVGALVLGTGNGPVNALDQALRKDLGKYSAALSDLRLVDYKVRILTGGTEAVTRVMVESADGKGNRWSTVGVSPNIVDASFEALTDSICYKLFRDRA